LTVTQVVVEQPPADPVAGLQNGHGVACCDELSRCGEPGQSRTDHDEVGPSAPVPLAACVPRVLIMVTP
jgi:hypothetical protein